MSDRFICVVSVFSVLMVVATATGVPPAAHAQSSAYAIRPEAIVELQGVSVDLRRQAIADGVVTRHVSATRDLVLIPNHPFAHSVRDALSSANPNVLTETVMVLPFEVNDQELLELFNALRRLSSLAVIRYFNEERQAYHDLFDSSYRVASEADTRPLPDPVVSAIPREDSLLVLQGLPPFHDVVSRYDYRFDGRSFHFAGSNLTRIRYRGFPVVGPGNMVTQLMVIRGANYVLVYGVGGARVTNPLGLLSSRIEGPFQYRTTGLFRWFETTHIDPLRDRRHTD